MTTTEITEATYLRQLTADTEVLAGWAIDADAANTFDCFERRTDEDGGTWMEWVGHSDATDIKAALTELRPGWRANCRGGYNEPPYVATWELE